MGFRVTAVLVAGLLVAATACGGSDSKEESSDNGVATATVPETSSDSGSGSSGLDDLGDALGTLDGDTGDCLSAGMAFLALSLAPLGFMAGGSQEDVDKLKSELDDLAGDIPAEIRGDFETYADGMEAYANAMGGVSFEDILDPAVQQKIEDASALLDTPEMKQAQENIEKYFDETCPGMASGDTSS